MARGGIRGRGRGWIGGRLGGLLVAAPLIIATVTAPAVARERIDLVLLAHGDRVTGEVIRLESANLSVRTINMGTVDIDWPDVVGLVSIQPFEVELASGERMTARLDLSERAGFLNLHVGGGVLREVPSAEVVGLEQLGGNLWRSRRGYVDMGWNYAQANASNNFSLAAELALQGRWFRWVTSLSSTIYHTDSVDTGSRRDELQSQLQIPVGLRWLLLGGAAHERNDDLDLEARDSAVAILAWVPRSSARGRVLLGSGLAESRESYFTAPEASSVSSGVLMATGEYHRFGRFGTRASLSTYWYAALSGDARQRFEVRGSIRQKLGSDFTITVSPYYSYDSQPPTTRAVEEDWGWVTSIGLMF